MHSTRSLPVVGILGGGQLAKMLAQSAAQLGARVHVLHHGDLNSAITPCPVRTGNWNDPDRLCDFARGCDVVTLENEFIEADALAALEAAGHRLFPSAACLALVQDKALQKQTLADAGLPTAAFRAVEGPDEVIDAAAELGWPLVLKRRKLGYDGKGNATVRGAADVAGAWARLDGGAHALYVEQFCPFTRELAVMVTRENSEPQTAPGGLACPGAAMRGRIPPEPTLDPLPHGRETFAPATRGRGGRTRESSTIAVYPVVDTVQRDHICHTVTAPARLTHEQASAAAEIGRRAVEAIGAVGSVGVEMFLMPDGRILVNELAPRVHNSGHYTIEACHCSQFENHIRAVLGWPLGDPALRAPAAAMVNLLGAGDGPPMPSGLDAALAVTGAHIHLYGKDRSVKGRKLGHVTALGATPEEALAVAQEAAAHLRFG